MSPLATSFTRRRTLQTLGGALIAAPFVARAQNPDNKLRHACIGYGGQGASDLRSIASHPDVEVIAICDTDSNRLEVAQKDHPKARVYQDWRELLDEEDGNIDSVNVSTPDHNHAIITAAAMDQNLHCYTQKPLTRTVEESRMLARLAAEKPQLVTQMGTQIASDLSNIRVVEIFQQGTLGKAREVYVWSNKTWGDPDPLPNRQDPVPPNLDWNNWLGPAAERPYINGAYHPNNWRKRLDFGTGTLGDMGAHIFHPALAAIETGLPLSIRSTGPRPNDSNWAINEELHYTMPGNERTIGETFPFHWYDGGTLPTDELRPHVDGGNLPAQGGLIICENGALLCPHVGLPTMFPQDRFETSHPRRAVKNHYHEWVDASLGREATLRSPFAWGAYVTETILLGGLASFFPEEELNYDAENMSFDNPEATTLLSRDYREDFQIPELEAATAGA